MYMRTSVFVLFETSTTPPIFNKPYCNSMTLGAAWAFYVLGKSSRTG